MAFDSLTEKLQNIFKNLRSKGRLTEDDVKEALKEIKRALLAADVNFKVVKDFIGSVQERAIGQDVMNGLNPGQMVIKIVNEELVRLMGSETLFLIVHHNMVSMHFSTVRSEPRSPAARIFPLPGEESCRRPPSRP